VDDDFFFTHGSAPMANLNKVMLIGRLTRDPETRTFSNGGKVANFGFAVTGQRKKNPETGQWEEEPCFLDCKAFNRETGRKLADLVEQYLKKGHQAYIEGHLILEHWDDRETGKKRSAIKVIVDNVEFLEPRQDGGEGGSRSARSSAPARMSSPAPAGNGHYEDEPDNRPPGGEEEIPF
jgi:single-strand DNA-binding protein